MTDIMRHTKIGRTEDFTEKLVDLFYRASKNSGLKMIQFSDLTSFLIEHEITLQKGAMASADMRYEESKLVDKKAHNNYIEKIYYFERIDKVILYE
jgi:hypothetical protein